MKVDSSVFLLIFYPTVALFIGMLALTVLYFRVSGDLQVCKNYYPEMSTLGCYFSSKTVRTPNK